MTMDWDLIAASVNDSQPDNDYEEICCAVGGRGRMPVGRVPRIPNIAYLYRKTGQQQQDGMKLRRMGRGRVRLMRVDDNPEKRPGHLQTVSPLAVIPNESEPAPRPRPVLEKLYKGGWRESDFPQLGAVKDPLRSSPHTKYKHEQESTMSCARIYRYSTDQLRSLAGKSCGVNKPNAVVLSRLKELGILVDRGDVPAVSHSDSASLADNLSNIASGISTTGIDSDGRNSIPDTSNHIPEPSDCDIDPSKIVIPPCKPNVVRPKSSVNRFNFAAVNKSLLDDISSLQNQTNRRPPKILSLTKANLDKYLNSNPISMLPGRCNVGMSKFVFDEEKADDEINEYQVGREDCVEQKEVPPDVKNRLGLLMDRMNGYLTEESIPVPELDNVGKNLELSDGINQSECPQLSCDNGASGSMPKNTLSSIHIREHTPMVEDKHHLDTTPDPEHTDNKCATAEAITEEAQSYDNNSVISNPLDSDYNVSSEDFVLELDEQCQGMVESESTGPVDPVDLVIKDIENTEVSQHINETTEPDGVGEDQPVEIQLSETLQEEIQGSPKSEICIDPGVSGQENELELSPINEPLTENTDDFDTAETKFKPVDSIEIQHKSCEKAGKIDRVDQLCDLSLPLPRNDCDSPDPAEDNEGFMLVKGKHSKKKALKPVVRQQKHADNAVWRLYGKCVIQVDGLPPDCDTNGLYEAVSGFGRIIDHQSRQIDKGCSVRFKLCSEDACDYAIQCLHDTDCLFPDANRKMECYKPQV